VLLSLRGSSITRTRRSRHDDDELFWKTSKEENGKDVYNENSFHFKTRSERERRNRLKNRLLRFGPHLSFSRSRPTHSSGPQMCSFALLCTLDKRDVIAITNSGKFSNRSDDDDEDHDDDRFAVSLLVFSFLE
jgi:hypothetical protein